MKKGIDYPGISVSYLCHDGEGNFLFNKRSTNCRDEHGCWDNGGGGIDIGDSVLDTLHKEIKEEYCTDVLEYEFLGYNDSFREHDGNKTHWVHLYFKVLVDKEKVSNGEPHKFDEIGWFRLDNLPSPMHSQFPHFMEKFGSRLT